MGHLSSKEGQIILGSAVVDDVHIILLVVVASLAKTGDVGNVVHLIISASVLLGAILLGRFFNKSL